MGIMSHLGTDDHGTIPATDKRREGVQSYSDETLIEDVVGSPKALKALKAKGINKVGDIRSMADVASLPGMSPGVIAQLAELPIRQDKPPTKDEDIEEGEHDVVLRSKYPGYIIRLLGGDIIPPPPGMPGRPMILQPIAIMFKDGAAVLKREAWLMQKYRRDTVKVMEEISKPATEKPWRAEAIRWLRNKRTHKQGCFIVLE